MEEQTQSMDVPRVCEEGRVFLVVRKTNKIEEEDSNPGLELGVHTLWQFTSEKYTDPIHDTSHLSPLICNS